MTTEAPKSIDELKKNIAIAATTGDDVAFNTLIKEYNSRKAEVAKALAEAARKESEALSGERTKLATELHKFVKTFQQFQKRLEAVKATGFTFKLDDPEQDITYKSVSLTVPQIKERKSSGGTGGAGKSKDEYGMSLAEIYDKFATEQDKADFAAADGNNSKEWVVKNRVKKAAIASGQLAPAK